MNTELNEIFEAAKKYHHRKGFAEDSGLSEDQRVDQWHNCLALAVDDLDRGSFSKLRLFSACVLNLDAELARLDNETSTQAAVGE